MARDDTRAGSARSCLVVAPHPDDETLGCGGSIAARAANGQRVVVAILTDGEAAATMQARAPDELAALRREEAVRAASQLGLGADQLVFLGFPDGGLEAAEPQLTQAMVDLLAAHAVDDVLCTAEAEPHPDHATVGRVVRAAAARLDPQPRVLEYPVWLWSSWPWRRGHVRSGTRQFFSLAVTRSVVRVRLGEYRSAKVSALTEYGSQLEAPEDPRGEGGLPRTVLRRARSRVELFLAR